MLIGVGSRRRSASQAIDLPSNGGVNLGRLVTGNASDSDGEQDESVGNPGFVCTRGSGPSRCPHAVPAGRPTSRVIAVECEDQAQEASGGLRSARSALVQSVGNPIPNSTRGYPNNFSFVRISASRSGAPHTCAK